MSINRTKRGFTLVEVLIVVILLAVLASVLIGSFGGMTGQSKRAALADQLRTLRSQIELYRMQHGDEQPPLAGGDWTPLVQTSTYDGKSFGPYLQSVPSNMLNTRSDIEVVTANVAYGDPVSTPGVGFVYNSGTGLIWATNTAGDKVFNELDHDDPNN